MDRKSVSPVIAIVLLLMMTVAAAGAAYFWLTQMQSGIQEQSTKSIENIMQSAGRRLIAQAAICKPTAPEGVVAWWEFYEGGGNKIHDSSENENTGTRNGANWTDGKVGQALDFDGSNDYIEVPHSNILDISNEITITTWVYIDENQDARIVNKHQQYRLNIYSIDWGDFYCEIYDASGSRYDFHHVFPSDPVGKWWHLTLTYVANERFKGYINGEMVHNKPAGGEIATTDNPLRLGSDVDGGRYFNGTIDEVRIYDRALSGKEINETYKGKMKVRVTVRNIGSVKIPEAEFVANLKKDGTTVDTDTYTTTSSIDTGDLKTLTFYFNEMRPDGEYNINIPGIGVSQTVNCQSLE